MRGWEPEGFIAGFSNPFSQTLDVDVSANGIIAFLSALPLNCFLTLAVVSLAVCAVFMGLKNPLSQNALSSPGEP
uniref:Uncharacterized protein n=1 Tax=Anguilla anguilla TaxID=7936 RepID=A0A0E9QYY8_ANGAN